MTIFVIAGLVTLACVLFWLLGAAQAELRTLRARAGKLERDLMSSESRAFGERNGAVRR